MWSNGYERVWHFHNNNFDDSVGNNSAANNGSTDATDKIIAGGRYFDGNDYIDSNFTKTYGTDDDFAYEAWWKTPTFGSGTRKAVAVKYEDNDCSQGVEREIRLAVRHSGENIAQFYAKDDSGSSALLSHNPSPETPYGAWHYSVITRDGGANNVYSYYDGGNEGVEGSAGGTITIDQSIYIGHIGRR